MENMKRLDALTTKAVSKELIPTPKQEPSFELNFVTVKIDEDTPVTKIDDNS